ncbi:MAG: flagellar hook capping FlgD N-terminal domain-containing protein [Acidimicrobiales bacterium]
MTDAVISTPASSAVTETASANTIFDGMGSDAFLKLLITQLRYQDPLSPADSGQMMAQTAQFAAMEATQKQTDFLEQNVGYQQFSVATSMLGSEVTALIDDESVTGVVIGVRTTDQGPRLQLDGGFDVAVKQVTHVAAKSAEPEASDA